MRDLRASDLAKELGLSRSQIARRASEIPCCRRTKGGHWRFRDCPKLRRWIKANKQDEEWDSITGPMEEQIAYYSPQFVKTFNPIDAISFVRTADQIIEKLTARTKSIIKRFRSKHARFGQKH